MADRGITRRVLLLAAAGPLARAARPPLLSSADAAFLRDQARRIALSARLLPGELGGKRRNETPYTMRVPGGNMGYPAFWIRDAVMMLGGDLIPAEEVEGWIRLIASTVRGQDWRVRDGVVVPAWAVPDHINFDGRATFYPGTYDTGTKQGGPPYGTYPPIDDDYYFVSAVWHHWRLTRSTRLFRSTVKTAADEVALSALCERVYARSQADLATGLCVSPDTEGEHAIDFGFCDSIRKSGKLLFPSLLKFQAARQLADLFQAAGEQGKARAYRERAGRIRAAIPATFLRPIGNTDAWLHSTTGVGNQPDVWGSAYAVWGNAVDRTVAARLGRSLAHAYREGTAVREGCVRHILTTDRVNRGGWEGAARIGVYQNGGYWGTPVGWYLDAVARVDRPAAGAMAADYLRFLRGHIRADGTAEAWEWFNPETGARANPLYGSTVILPWLSLQSAGLC